MKKPNLQSSQAPPAPAAQAAPLTSAFDVKKIGKFKVGDRVTVTGLPPDLDDRAQIDTPGVFRHALGKTFRIRGFDEHGHLELQVTKSDYIWIEPEFVSLAG